MSKNLVQFTWASKCRFVSMVPLMDGSLTPMWMQDRIYGGKKAIVKGVNYAPMLVNERLTAFEVAADQPRPVALV